MNNIEKRRFARVEVNIGLTLKKVTSPYELYNYDGINIEALAINLSPKGIAFKTNTVLELNSTYMATIHYKDFNPYIIMLKIVNDYTDSESNSHVYGCQFEGINRNLLTNPLFSELYNSMYN